ncbi:hypothetical protein ZIOFF_031831 [Zingiber officinale]|uniref:Uncharacterized protein n=1 Tax=Zingiber officinale TaxID=94328 RepID=A0A8J5GFG2_ZINOF|nr:hypothetical protein ZIOFF_031831 [Zingiber officinale]
MSTLGRRRPLLTPASEMLHHSWSRQIVAAEPPCPHASTSGAEPQPLISADARRTPCDSARHCRLLPLPLLLSWNPIRERPAPVASSYRHRSPCLLPSPSSHRRCPKSSTSPSSRHESRWISAHRNSDHWILVPLHRWYRLVIDPLGGTDFIHRIRLSSGQHCSPAIHSVGHLVTTVSFSDMSYQQFT